MSLGIHRESIDKICWARYGALGDLLVSLSALVESHVRYPRAKICILGPRLWLEIVHPQQFPYIEEIAVIERYESQCELFVRSGDQFVSSGKKTSLLDYFRQFPVVINLRIDSLRFAFPAWLAGVPTHIGTCPAFWSWLYTDWAPWFGKDPLLHERDAPLLVLELAKAGNYWQRLGRKSRTWLREYIKSSRLISRWQAIGLPRCTPQLQNFSRQGIYLNPTSSRREKAWPSHRFFELALELQSQGRKVSIIGAPSETDWLTEVARDQFPIIQPPSLGDVFTELEKCQVLVTNTSSLQFAAATVGTPVVTIMGRARPEIWGPIGPKDRYVRSSSQVFQSRSIFAQEVEAYEKVSVASVMAEVYAVLAKV